MPFYLINSSFDCSTEEKFIDAGSLFLKKGCKPNIFHFHLYSLKYTRKKIILLAL